jgi:small redox-active disulfide protein 2
MTKIQILGSGCSRCKQLMENAEAAARGLGIEYELEKVTDIREIVKFGVLSTPALVGDGRVKLAGKVAPPEEVRTLLAGG